MLLSAIKVVSDGYTKHQFDYSMKHIGLQNRDQSDLYKFRALLITNGPNIHTNGGGYEIALVNEYISCDVLMHTF